MLCWPCDFVLLMSVGVEAVVKSGTGGGGMPVVWVSWG